MVNNDAQKLANAHNTLYLKMISQKKRKSIQLFEMALNSPQWTVTNSTQESRPQVQLVLDESKDIVQKKTGEKFYLLCSRFISQATSTPIGTLSERIIEHRLKNWLEADNSINPTQEGFRPKTVTVRSLHLLNLLIEKSSGTETRSPTKHRHEENVQ